MDTITLSSKGQLVIPKALRDGASLAPGDRLSVRLVNGEIRLRRLDIGSATRLDDVAGCLAKQGRKRLSPAQEKAAIQARLKTRHASP